MVNWTLLIIQWGGTFLFSFIVALIIASLIFLRIYKKMVKKAKIDAPEIMKGGNENKDGFIKKEEERSGTGGGRREGTSGRERNSRRGYLTEPTEENNYGSGTTINTDKVATGQGRRIQIQPPKFDSGTDTGDSGTDTGDSGSEGRTKNTQPDFK